MYMDHASESEDEPSTNGELRNNQDDGVTGKETRIEEHELSARRLKQRRQEIKETSATGTFTRPRFKQTPSKETQLHISHSTVRLTSAREGLDDTRLQQYNRRHEASTDASLERRGAVPHVRSSPTEQSRFQRKHRHTPNQCENNTCGWSHQPVRRRARRHRSTIARERIRQGRGVVASPSVQVSIGEQIWSTPSSEPHTPRTNARTTCVITVSRRRTATPCDTGDDGTGNRKAVRPSFHKDDLTNQCKTPSLLVPERRWRQSARRAPTPNWR